MHVQLKLPLLHVRRKQHLTNFMYEPAHMPKFVHNRNLLTRNGDTKLFKVLQPSKEKTKKAILFKGSSLWNSHINRKQVFDLVAPLVNKQKVNADDYRD